MKHPENIIISRTDSIGDVVLTLPVAKALKDYFPAAQIAFIGRPYTRPVIDACRYIDSFIDLEDFLAGEALVAGKRPDVIVHVFPVAAIARRAKELQIPLRIGTTNRLFHWTTCNKLVRLSRRNSPLHEAQLNLRLLKALGIDRDYTLEEIGQSFGLVHTEMLQPRFAALPDPSRFNLILHPKSQGSAREWGLDNFIRLVHLLQDAPVKIFLSGTSRERAQLQPLFDAVGDKVTDITGMMDLRQFISFINACDGLVANSTGPLHIAAALGKYAFGIYPPIRPMHPGRWGALGMHAGVFVQDRSCNDCRKDAAACHCIREVMPEKIGQAILAIRPGVS